MGLGRFKSTPDKLSRADLYYTTNLFSVQAVRLKNEYLCR